MCRLKVHSGIVATVLLLTACKGTSGTTSQPFVPGIRGAFSNPTAGLAARDTSNGKIKHVVIIIQENRTLNNLFYGFPGARTAKYGYDSHDQKVELRPIGLETTWDLAHFANGALAACNGVGSIPGTDCRMNGFDKEAVQLCGGSNPPCPKNHPMYAYVPHSETKPYFEMGRQYVLADEMYASDFDASSFVSHQYIIAAQAQSSVDYPDVAAAWGCSGGRFDVVAKVDQNRNFPKGHQVVCWNTTTMGDELDQAGLPWAFYTGRIGANGGIWSAYQTIKHIYKGPDWADDIITPQTQFYDDVSKGKLRTVTWITPTYQNSDHAGAGTSTGPSWVASLVNAIGESKSWSSTAIFVFWDDYGGWYDPEPPEYADYDGLGFRLPLLVISPFAKKGAVSHTHYEHGSMLKFVEDHFGLGRLSASDRRANSLDDCFNFNQAPRKFVRIHAPHDQGYFRIQPLDLRPPDSE